ncbi:MAG: hypothetical protein CL858_18465 [Cupriavidus sp.]|nr:hypothetical protein [Cupriavidus sp.]
MDKFFTYEARNTGDVEGDGRKDDDTNLANRGRRVSRRARRTLRKGVKIPDRSLAPCHFQQIEY